MLESHKQEIKSFVGFCFFFQAHIKDFARICEPLNIATRKDAEYTKVAMTGKALEVIVILKAILCS